MGIVFSRDRSEVLGVDWMLGNQTTSPVTIPTPCCVGRITEIWVSLCQNPWPGIRAPTALHVSRDYVVYRIIYDTRRSAFAQR